MIVLYRILVPFAALLLPVAALFNTKLRAGLKLRGRVGARPKFALAPIWIHAASGEFEYAKAVIRELKASAPDVPVVVTYFSPTYARNVAEFPGVDHAEPLPLDLPGPCAAFLDDVRPRACLIARTDFWPEMLTQAGKRGIPRVVFAYTQKPVRGIKAWASRAHLRLVDEVLTVSEADRAATLALMPGARVTVVGDPRYDQVEFRLSHPRPLPPVLKPKLPCLVAGSTWSQDEAVLLPALDQALRDRRLQLIVVPHEPTAAHVAALERAFAARGLTTRRYSEETSWDDRHALIVDRTGILAELYRWGQFAFVGGSFRRTVHSVMEALGAGAVTFVGPKHLNNREAIEFSRLTPLGRHPGLTVVDDAAAWAAALDEWLNGEDVAAFGEKLRGEFSRRLGAARAISDRYRDPR